MKNKFDKNNVHDIVELSNVQKGMLYEYLANPEGNLYHVQLVFDVEGSFDPVIFQQAFDLVQANNEILRSVFVWEEVSKPLQIILKSSPFKVTFHDLSANENVVSDTHQIVSDNLSETFDLNKLPLRVTVVKQSTQKFTLTLTHHHILYDGWSTGILLKEVFEQYKSLSGSGNAARHIKVPYKNILQALKKQANAQEFNAYWNTYLSDYEITSGLNDLISEGVEVPSKSETLSIADDKFSSFAKVNRVSQAAVIYAAYGMLLQKIHNTNDVVFGTTVSNRDANIKGAEMVMGNFINTIPLRVSNLEKKSLLDVVEQTNANVIERSPFHNTSYIEIKQLLGLKPQQNLFDSLLIIENYPLENDKINGNKNFNISLNNYDEKTEIPLVITVFFEENIEIEFTYKPNLISADLINTLVNGFQSIFESILTNANTPVKSVSLISEQEKSMVLNDFNNTTIAYAKDRTLPELLEDQVNKTPDAVALIGDGQQMTYATLNEKANILAHDLRQRGVKTGDVVALYTSRSMEMFVAIWAVLKSGGCYLPLDPTFPKERLEYMLSDANAQVIINTIDLDTSIFKLGAQVQQIPLVVENLSGNNSNLSNNNDSEDLAYVIYTSGSTGQPKGVMISHRAVHNYIVAMNASVPFDKVQKLVSVTTFSFDIFVTESLLPLTKGLSVVIANEEAQKDPALLGQLIASENVEMIQTTPSRYKMLMNDWDSFELVARSIKLFLVGGEAFPTDLFETFKAHTSANIFNVYGPTETTVWSACHDLTNENEVTIGGPFGNTQFYILDSDLNLQPIGVQGDLYIAGDGLAHGYWNNQALTNKVFIENPYKAGSLIYKTGDTAKWRADGTVDYLGRSDSQIKIRGYRVELDEINNHLKTHDQVQESVVVMKKINDHDMLVAYYTGSQEMDAESLKAFMSDGLPYYMIPANFMFLNSFPMTPNGKLNRKQLPDPELEINNQFVAANNDFEKDILKIWQEILGQSKISTNQNFFDIGGDSLKLISVSAKLKKELKKEVSVTQLFNYPTIASLANYLQNGQKKSTQKTEKDNVTTKSNNTSNSIAIIGMAGRFPGASDLNEFWDNLKSGKECIQKGESQQEEHVNAKGHLDKHDHFDAEFFNYTSSEVVNMDPQIRIFHECVWQALENAGYNPYAYEGKIGLYGGASVNPYYDLFPQNNSDDDFIEQWDKITYGDKDFLCPRVSYRLNLKGPSLNITTACSTSLVAVDTACNQLLSGKCDIALAGGVSISYHDNDGYTYRKGMIFSEDGSCKAFDANSTGTVSGNGVGVIAMKPLEAAIADGDHIHAVIKGTAVNNDGFEKIGFTAPSIQGQANVIADAFENAGVAPETIGYVETHGTGTSLGDPIEVQGLSTAFNTEKTQFCAIGSVKTNIGHLDAAAGIAGLIKAVLSLKNKEIAPSLHFETPNPNIDFANSPFYVSQELQSWERNGTPRRAGISSFGIGGTNAHVILEEAPELKEQREESRNAHFLPISAKNEASFIGNVDRMISFLEDKTAINLSDVSFTALTGRAKFDFRKMLAVTDREDAIKKLTQLKNQNLESLKSSVEFLPKVVFMFPGQGAQYSKMGLDLYNEEPFYRGCVNECLQQVKSIAGVDLKPILFSSENEADKRQHLINHTRYTQPCLFITEYALAKLLMNWGIRPDAMIGHSIGEYVAACISGLFSLEDALKVVLKRGELMQSAPEGAMLHVNASKEKVLTYLQDNNEAAVSVVNSKEACVISGTKNGVERAKEAVEADGFEGKPLPVSHAFHSFMMDSILLPFEKELSKTTMGQLTIPVISNLTGKTAQNENITQPKYWVDHLRNEVNFSDGMDFLLEDDDIMFIEVGPGNSLSNLLRNNDKKTNGHKVISLMRHPKKNINDVANLFAGMSQLWENDITLDWTQFFQGQKRTKVELPTYYFDSKPIASNKRDYSNLSGNNSIPVRQPISEWLYTLSWKKVVQLPQQTTSENYLIFADNSGLGKLLTDRFDENGVTYQIVNRGEAFAKQKNGFTVNPQDQDSIESLFDSLKGDFEIDHMIYLWSLDRTNDNTLSQTDAAVSQIMQLSRVVQSFYHTYKNTNAHISVYTNQLYDVLGIEEVKNSPVALSGLLPVITQEYGISVGHKDVNLDELLQQGITQATYDSLLSKNNGAVQALRGAHSWKQSFEKVTQQDLPSRIKSQGVYVITGGLGELGRILAAYLLKNYQAKVILLGRSEIENEPINNPSPDAGQKREKLNQLKALGTVDYHVCDIRDLDALQQTVSTIAQKFGGVNGVIHAAGSIQGSSIDLMEKLQSTHFEEQLSTKMEGLINLHDVFSNQSLDFCLITSSISSFLGGVRFGAYAAANKAVDQQLNWLKSKQELPYWTSVNLDGLAIGDNDGQGINAKELVQVVETCLAHAALSQQIVSVADFDQRIESLVATSAQTDEQNKANMLVPTSSDDVEQNLIDLWKKFFGVDQIETTDDFFDLGGDSLKVLTMIAQIQKGFDVEMSVAEFFELSTFENICNHLKQNISTEENLQEVSIPKAEERDAYPLSSVQKRLFFLHQFDESSVAYNMPLVMEMSGNIDLGKLELVFRSLIARHEVLRTYFEIEGEQPCQRISEEADFNVEIYDTVDDRQAAVRGFVRPFDLSQTPLLRVGYMKTDETEGLLMVDMPHIITDGISKSVLVQDFTKLYSGEELTPLDIHYKDYATWQSADAYLEGIQKHKQFWVEEFAADLKPLELPTDHVRPAVKTLKGSSIDFNINDTDIASLQKIAKQNGTTVFATFLSIYYIFLHKLSGQSDIGVGVPVSGRQYADVERMMGMFINTLPLRSQVDGESTFNEFLTSVKDKSISCFDHQAYPYELLVDELNMERDTSRNPLFDVLFSYENFERTDVEIPGVTINPCDDDQNVSKFDLTLTIKDHEGQFDFSFEYSTELFEPSTIVRFIGYFRQLLVEITAAPDQEIRHFEVLPSTEKKLLINTFNDTFVPYASESTIHGEFEKCVKLYPEAEAVVFEETSLTYSTLNERSNRLAREILSHDLKEETVVGILLPRSQELLVSILAVLKSGCSYIPLDPDYPTDRIKYIIQDSGLNVLLTDTSMYDMVQSYDASLNTIDVFSEDIAQHDATDPALSISASQLAYMIYTSGSTGNPKGVMIEHRNVLNFVKGIVDRIPMDTCSSVLCLTTVSFDIFVLETIVPLLSGKRVVLASENDQKDAEALSYLVNRHQVEAVQMTPSHLKLILSAKEGDKILPSVEALMLGGEALPVDILLKLQRVYRGRIFNMYGPTETTVWSTIGELTYSDKVNIGYPIANTIIRILNDDDELQGIGMTGELCIGGDGVGRGYWKQSALTEERFIEDPLNTGQRIYRTGDIARWLPDGRLECLGRKDSQVKVRGYRIELGEVESQMTTHNEVTDAVVDVKVIADEPTLVGYYQSESELTPATFKNYLSSFLPDYMVPSYFMKMDSFPLTPNGKTDRRSLPVPELKAGADYVAASTEMEEQLVAIWSEVLELNAEVISVNASFFDLGGNSLKATIVVNKIVKHTEVKIPLQEFFAASTIAEVAEHIENHLWTRENINKSLTVGEEFVID